MTPAEHRAEAERLLEFAADSVSFTDEQAEVMRQAAQVHATLALAPTPPPLPEQPQHRWDLSKPQAFPDATGGVLTVLPVSGGGGVIFDVQETVGMFEDPDVLRFLASLLTAHANRLESKL